MSRGQLTALIDRLITLDEAVCEAEVIELGQAGQNGLIMLKELLAAAETDARFWAVRGLWANGSPEAVSLLIKALRDNDDMVRSGAALALGEIEAEMAVEALVQLMTGERAASGDHAADALAKIGQPAATALIKALQDERVWVRVRAAKALVPTESRRAIGPLFYALEDESYLVRHYAELALTRMGIGQMVYFPGSS